MRTCIYDIETIANPAMIPLLPEVQVDSRLKDPAKIEAARKEKELKQIEEMGLDKATCLIACASVLDLANDTIKSFVLNPVSNDEAELLTSLWEHMHGFSRFVSFNGISFDVPVMTFRSMVNRIQPSVKISTKKYQITNHIDVRAILGDWDMRAKGTQDYYCKMLLGADQGKPDGIDGSMVQSYWDVGAYDEVVEYCEDDVRKLARLYEMMKGYYV